MTCKGLMTKGNGTVIIGYLLTGFMRWMLWLILLSLSLERILSSRIRQFIRPTVW